MKGLSYSSLDMGGGEGLCFYFYFSSQTRWQNPPFFGKEMFLKQIQELHYVWWNATEIPFLETDKAGRLPNKMSNF